MATSEGKEMEEEMVLPQHTVVVETATAGKEVEKATKRIKKNSEISHDNNNKKEESEVDKHRPYYSVSALSIRSFRPFFSLRSRPA